MRTTILLATMLLALTVPGVAAAAQDAAAQSASVAEQPSRQQPAATAPRARQRSAEEVHIEAGLFAGHLRARTEPGAYGYANEAPRAPLRWAEDIAEVARAWSDEMARTRVFQHNPAYTSQVCCWTMIGENIVMGGPGYLGYYPLDDLAERFMQLWMDSQGHRENILRDGFAEVGIGVTVTADNAVYATAVLRTPTGGAPASSATYPGTAAPEANDTDANDTDANDTSDAEQPNPPPSPSPEPSPQDPARPDPPLAVPELHDITEVCPGAQTTSRYFHDVVGSAAPAVDCLADRGITLGVGPGRFDPAGTLTRAQLALFVERTILSAGGWLPEPSGVAFSDLAADSAAGRAVDRLATAGIIGGFPDGSFRPGAPVTRVQMARFLIGALEHHQQAPVPVPSAHYFHDLPADSAAATTVNQLAAVGIAAGDGAGYYDPASAVRRDQMARFLARWLAAVS